MTQLHTERRRRTSVARRLAIVVALAALVVPACGKKGPPRPPLVRLPARPEPFAVRRLGPVVYLQFQVPAANADGTTPADVERVEVYAFTGQPANTEDLFKRGTLVASVPVRRPPEQEPAPKSEGKNRGKPETWPAPPPRPAPSMQNGFDQGDVIVVSEAIGDAQLAELPALIKPGVAATPVGAPALAPTPSTPTRFYLAVGVNRKRQKGPASTRQAVALSAPPAAPTEASVTYTEQAFTVTWTPAAGSSAFNVYEVPSLPAGAPAKAPLGVAAIGKLPVPVNPKPLDGPPFVDSRVSFGTPRCYVVRAVSAIGAQAIESDATAAPCVTPVDTFPPAAPAGLTAIGSAGAIGLIWEANREADLAGYLVLRAQLPGAEFVPLTPAPIAQTTFSDTTVVPGVRYAYVVLAVDAAGNRSARSNRVEESAR